MFHKICEQLNLFWKKFAEMAITQFVPLDHPPMPRCTQWRQKEKGSKTKFLQMGKTLFDFLRIAHVPSVAKASKIEHEGLVILDGWI
jgi:hypothetical protein